MHVYMLVYLYLRFSLDFARTLCGKCQVCSVRPYEEPIGRNPTHHRPIEQVSLNCTIKTFSFLDQVNTKHNFNRRVWIKFVKKTKGGSQWKEELTIRMDIPICGVANVFLISIVLYRHTQKIYFSSSVGDKNKEIIGVGTMYASSCIV